MYKGEFVSDSRSHEGLAHTISADTDVLSVKVGEELPIPLRIVNTGTARWLNRNDLSTQAGPPNYIGIVQIGSHLYDDAGNLLNLDFSRFALEDCVAPNQTYEKCVNVRFGHPGTYKLGIDLVSEGVCWFESIGSRPKIITVVVEPAIVESA